MAKRTGKRGPISLLQRAAASLARALSRRTDKVASSSAATPAKAASAPSRKPRRQADIPLDQIAAAYTPTQTSLKAPFRASGADRQSDQEYASGFSDGRWNDEDHYTNKSGDPRIGTHNRTYEPETEPESKS